MDRVWTVSCALDRGPFGQSGVLQRYLDLVGYFGIIASNKKKIMLILDLIPAES